MLGCRARLRDVMMQPNVRKPRRDYSRWRAASLIAVHLLIGLHIAHWLVTGRTLAPLEFNEVLHTLHLGIITAGFLFMALTIVGTLVAGRFFCSWGCHILALQDLSAWLLGKLHIRPQPIRSRALLWVPVLAMLYLFVWPQIARQLDGSGLPTLHVQSDAQGWASFTTNQFWRNLPGPGITVLTFVVVGTLTVYFLGTRSFCRYACPYGVIFGLADRVAPGKIKLVGDCSQCGLCTAQCHSQILVHREVARFGKVVDPQCLKDLDCVAVCPNQALAYGFTKPSFFQALPAREREGRPYSFTWGEDVFIAGSALLLVVIYRGLYDAIPFLLAVAISIILAALFVTALRLWRSPTVRVSNFLLKHEGQMTRRGWQFAALVAGLGLLSLHSGFVHWQTFAGRRALQRAVAEKAGQTGSQARPASLQSALAHLRLADRVGVWTSPRLGHDLATACLLSGEPAEAEKQLGRILEKQPDDFAAALRLGRLAFSQQRPADAERLLQPIFAAKESRFGPAEFRSRSAAFLLAGQIAESRPAPAEALRHYEAAARDNVQNGEAHLAAGTLLARGGRFAEAEPHLRLAEKYYSDRAAVLENLAIVQLQLGRHEAAAGQLRELLQDQPRRPQLHYHLGLALHRAGQSAEAIRHFQIALELKPDYAAAQTALASLQQQAGSVFGQAQMRKP
jgi:tetratricopeptide (TPR) repeat protein/polyferredoxin